MSIIPATKYNILLRILHWSMALIIIGLVVSGFTKDYWTKEYQRDFYYWHKSFGVLVFGLLVLRIIIRLITKIPPLPDNFDKFTKFGAKAGHLALYIFMIVAPVSGYLMSVGGGYGVSMFGIKIPNFIEKDKTVGGIAHEVHEIGGIIFAIIVVLHILAVIKHHKMDKEPILKRMV